MDKPKPIPVRIDNGDGTFTIVMLTPGPRILVPLPERRPKEPSR